MTAVPRHGTLSMTITAVTPRTGRAPQPITTH
jgi:hypothetical protein